MSFDFTKLSTAFAQMDAAKKRFEFGGLGNMSAALGVADRIGTGLDWVDACGVGADPAGARGAGIGSLTSDVLATGRGDVTGFRLAEARLTPLGRGLSALANPSDEGLLSAATGLGKVPSGMEKPSWMEPLSELSGAAEKMTRSGVLDGLGRANKWRGFGVSTSPAGANRDFWDLGSTHWGFDATRELSGLGKPGVLGGFEPGRAGATGFYGTGGLAGTAGLAKGSAAFGGLFKAFDGLGEIVRKASDLSEAMRPYWDWWGEIAEEAARAARRIATQPARPGDSLLALAAHDALEAMQRGRHWVASRFLEQRLNLRATPEMLEALWLFLKRSFERPLNSPPLWLTLEASKTRAYLATAIFRIAERIKRKRRMDDDIWGKARNLDGERELVRPGGGRLIYIADRATDDFADSGLDPAKLAEHGTYDRDLILDEIMATGTPVDREIVALIRTGRYDRADIRNLIGSTRLQAFERKVQRRTQNGKN